MILTGAGAGDRVREPSRLLRIVAAMFPKQLEQIIKLLGRDARTDSLWRRQGLCGRCRGASAWKIAPEQAHEIRRLEPEQRKAREYAGKGECRDIVGIPRCRQQLLPIQSAARYRHASSVIGACV